MRALSSVVPPVADRPCPEPVARFAFRLPACLLLVAEVGRVNPCLHRVRADIDAEGQVQILGFDRLESCAAGAVMEQAMRLLDRLCRGRELPALRIPAELGFTSRIARPERYAIVIGANVAIARTAEAPALFADGEVAR